MTKETVAATPKAKCPDCGREVTLQRDNDGFGRPMEDRPYRFISQCVSAALTKLIQREGLQVETKPSLALELRSNLHGGPSPALHDGKTVKAKCVICGNFNRFWHIISACNFCQSCVSTALSSPLEQVRTAVEPRETSSESVWMLERRHPGGDWTLYYAVYPSRLAAEAAMGNARPPGIEWRVAEYVRKHSPEEPSEGYPGIAHD
jgi:hypothetical protein